MTQAPGGVRLRHARMDDIPAVVALQARSWRTSYRGIIDDAFLDAIPMQQWIEAWHAHFFTGDTRCIVAEESHRLTGFTSVGRPSGVDDLSPSIAELHTIYVEASHHGLGLGRLLMDDALDHLREERFSEVVLWVLEGNQRARRFYESGGWQADGTRAADYWGATSVARVRYRLTLPA